MFPRRHATYALSALLLAAAALPATASAHSASASADPFAATTGGGGLGGPTGTGTPAPTAGTGGAPIATSGDGVTLDTTSTTMLRQALTFSGSAPSGAGDTIEIQRQSATTGGAWTNTAAATVAPTGAFTTTWTTTQPGQFAVRAVVESATAPQATAAVVTPPLTVTVYRGAKATLYGPGFYGRQTACGTRLTRSTIGVANRTLPCGTQVSILYQGQTLTVPVIDRGPYANGADWDLTMATASVLGMNGTEQIGAVALPAPATNARRSSRRSRG